MQNEAFVEYVQFSLKKKKMTLCYIIEITLVWKGLNMLSFFPRIKEDHVIQHGLVVDGASLSLALRGHEKLFMEVCKNCSAVLCCRMAPLQKAKVAARRL